MLTFRNPEDKTSCIVLNLLKAENQRSGAAREERVTKTIQVPLLCSVDAGEINWDTCTVSEATNRSVCGNTLDIFITIRLRSCIVTLQGRTHFST